MSRLHARLALAALAVAVVAPIAAASPVEATGVSGTGLKACDISTFSDLPPTEPTTKEWVAVIKYTAAAGGVKLYRKDRFTGGNRVICAGEPKVNRGSHRGIATRYFDYLKTSPDDQPSTWVRNGSANNSSFDGQVFDTHMGTKHQLDPTDPGLPSLFNVWNFRNKTQSMKVYAKAGCMVGVWLYDWGTRTNEKTSTYRKLKQVTLDNRLGESDAVRKVELKRWQDSKADMVRLDIQCVDNFDRDEWPM